MFLKYLEEENKKRFLQLCVHAAYADEILEEAEQEMMREYCREMNIPEVIPNRDIALEKVLNEIKDNSNHKEKNIIILELLGLLKADGVYDEREKVFLKKVVDAINMKEDTVKNIEKFLDEYIEICAKLYTLIAK